MEWITHWHLGWKKYRQYWYILLFLLAGILLMCLPTDSTEQTVITEIPRTTLQEQLSELLSKVSGAGRVEVLLSEQSGEEIHYQADEDLGSNDRRSSTVLIESASREEHGLVRRIDAPVYQGAVILCQGADSAKVRLALVEAVKLATGLTADRITVLKMK